MTTHEITPTADLAESILDIIGHCASLPREEARMKVREVLARHAKPVPADTLKDAAQALRSYTVSLDASGMPIQAMCVDRLAAALEEMAKQEPVALSADVREYLQEGINNATQGEDDDYDFARQLGLLLGPLYLAPIAAADSEAIAALRRIVALEHPIDIVDTMSTLEREMVEIASAVLAGEAVAAKQCQCSPRERIGDGCAACNPERAADLREQQGPSDEEIDAVAASMPDGAGGMLKTWGYRQFARALLSRYGQASSAAQTNSGESAVHEAEEGPCREADGCPTELAVLQRFWRQNRPDEVRNAALEEAAKECEYLGYVVDKADKTCTNPKGAVVIARRIRSLKTNGGQHGE